MKDQTGVRADAYFSIVPEWLLDHADIGPRAIQLYAVLGRYADQQGKAFPSRRTLARRCRCSVGAVDTARRELEAAGALVVERRMSDDDGQETNLYTVIRGNPLAAHDEAPLSADGQPPLSAGWEENESHHEPEPSEPETHGELALAYDPVKGTRIDGRNLPWDSLVAETGADERIEKGKIARALKTIRTVCAADYNLGANAELDEGFIASEIRVRARLYRDRWPDVELTPTALASNWSRVTTHRPGRSLDSALDAAQRGIDAAERERTARLYYQDSKP